LLDKIVCGGVAPVQWFIIIAIILFTNPLKHQKLWLANSTSLCLYGLAEVFFLDFEFLVCFLMLLPLSSFFIQSVLHSSNDVW
jgi:hypothetical protein